MQELERIAKRWNALDNDKDHWEYVRSHKNEIKIILDEDFTILNGVIKC